MVMWEWCCVITIPIQVGASYNLLKFLLGGDSTLDYIDLCPLPQIESKKNNNQEHDVVMLKYHEYKVALYGIATEKHGTCNGSISS